MILKLQSSYSKQQVATALKYCMDRRLFSSVYLKETLEFFCSKKIEVNDSGVLLPAKYSRVTAETRAIDAYMILTAKGAKRDEQY